MSGCCSCGVLLYCYAANVRGRIECCKSEAQKNEKKIFNGFAVARFVPEFDGCVVGCAIPAIRVYSLGKG